MNWNKATAALEEGKVVQRPSLADPVDVRQWRKRDGLLEERYIELGGDHPKGARPWAADCEWEVESLNGLDYEIVEEES